MSIFFRNFGPHNKLRTANIIMHLIFCFSFLLSITATQREIENNAYAKTFFFLGGGAQIRCIMGDVQVAYWPFSFLSLVTVPEVFAIFNSAQFNFMVSNVALLQ